MTQIRKSFGGSIFFLFSCIFILTLFAPVADAAPVEEVAAVVAEPEVVAKKGKKEEAKKSAPRKAAPSLGTNWSVPLPRVSSRRKKKRSQSKFRSAP